MLRCTDDGQRHSRGGRFRQPHAGNAIRPDLERGPVTVRILRMLGWRWRRHLRAVYTQADMPDIILR
jgi:hypothetical protein